MNDPDFSLSDSRVAIVGLGLMGGSLALSLQDRCCEIVGVDSDSAARTFAVERGFVHRTTDFDSALAGSDIFILATPVRTILEQIARLHSSTLDPRHPVLVLDLGSTKSSVVARMKDLPAAYDPLGGHPMCGKETGGIGQAEPGLYREKPFVLCPLDRTTPAGIALAHELVSQIGARPLLLDAERHDAFAALVSHLPYTVAMALMGAALEAGDDLVWQMAASGFRDTTRLAASDLTMMIDILLTNRQAILDSLAHFRAQLDSLTAAIQSGDADRLRAALQSAQAQRARLFAAPLRESGAEKAAGRGGKAP